MFRQKSFINVDVTTVNDEKKIRKWLTLALYENNDGIEEYKFKED